MRNKVGLINAGCLLAAFAVFSSATTAVFAAPITYTFTMTASGQFGSAPAFVDIPFTVVAVGDTANIVPALAGTCVPLTVSVSSSAGSGAVTEASVSLYDNNSGVFMVPEPCAAIGATWFSGQNVGYFAGNGLGQQTTAISLSGPYWNEAVATQAGTLALTSISNLTYAAAPGVATTTNASVPTLSELAILGLAALLALVTPLSRRWRS